MNVARTRRSEKVASDKAVVTAPAPIGDLRLSLRGADRLLEYLKEAGAVLGYRVPPDARVTEILDGTGPAGHALQLKSPPSGFLPLQRVTIEDYVKALSAYNGLEYTIEWDEPVSTIALIPLEGRMSTAKTNTRRRVRDLLLPSAYKACRDMGKVLVAHGFRVREPVPAALITHKSKVNGFAIIVKYPYPKSTDKAGIGEVYDRILPFMADAHARGLHLRAETLREGDTTLMFFTRSRRFVPTDL